MYITGHFIGVVLLCAGIAELVLADQLRSKTQMTQEEVEHFELKQMMIRCRRLGILSNSEEGQIDKLRKLRNALNGVDELGLFFAPLWLGDINKDVLGHLQSVRDLLLKFYGEEDIHKRSGSNKSGDS